MAQAVSAHTVRAGGCGTHRYFLACVRTAATELDRTLPRAEHHAEEEAQLGQPKSVAIGARDREGGGLPAWPDSRNNAPLRCYDRGVKRFALVVAAALLLGWFFLGPEWGGRHSSRADHSPRAVAGGEPSAPAAEPLADPNVPGSSGLALDPLESASVETKRTRLAGASSRGHSTLVRGRVVDGRTRVPVSMALGLGLVFLMETDENPELGERHEELDVRLGHGGTFEVETRQPERLLARVVEWETGMVLEERGLHRHALEREADGSWVLPVHVGWFARLEPEARGAEKVVVRSASLSDEFDLQQKRWPLMNLSARERPFVVYRVVHRNPGSAERRFLLVNAQDEEGQEWRARVEVAARNGIVTQPIRFPLMRRTCASGRVVDEAGLPWLGAGVGLMPLDGSLDDLGRDNLWGHTDDEGVFELCDLLPGRFRVKVSGPFTAGSQEQVRLVEGPNDLGTIVLPRGERRSEVEGELVSSDRGSEDPFALVVLRSHATGLEFVSLAGLELSSEPDGRAGFGFRAVPDGSYDLALQALDGRVYPGAPPIIAVPCEKLVIEAQAQRMERIQVLCRNARTGASVEAQTVFYRRGGHWLPVMIKDDGLFGRIDVLLVWAEGFAPRRVDYPTPQRASGGELSIEIDLEPGWGRIVFARSASTLAGQEREMAAWFGPPLASVSVVGDHGELARTDASGMALVVADEPQGRLRVVARGYPNQSAEVVGGAVLLLAVRAR